MFNDERKVNAVKCIRCGKCCETQICDLGIMAFKTTEYPCPGLSFKNNIAECGLVITEVIFKDILPINEPMIPKLLGIGKGCNY